MKKAILSATIVALIAGVVVRPSVAVAQNGSQAVPHKIGLIDMAEIFKNYTKFKALREDLKNEIKKSDGRSKGMVTQLQALQEKIKSPKYLDDSQQKKQWKNDLLDLSAQYKAFRQKQQIEFLDKESKIYKDIYLEVTTAVRQYAEFYKYSLILRYNKQGVQEATAPKDILSRMNRLVVYIKPGEDITSAILSHLNKEYDPTGAISNRVKQTAAATPRN